MVENSNFWVHQEQLTRLGVGKAQLREVGVHHDDPVREVDALPLLANHGSRAEEMLQDREETGRPGKLFKKNMYRRKNYGT